MDGVPCATKEAKQYRAIKAQNRKYQAGELPLLVDLGTGVWMLWRFSRLGISPKIGHIELGNVSWIEFQDRDR